MYQPMAPCSSCARHVRVGEPACPFCGEPVEQEIVARVVPPATVRLARAAAFVFGTTVAAAGCASFVGPGDAGADVAARDGGRVGPNDGSPSLPDAGPGPVDVAIPSDAPADAGGGLNMYGTPPPPDDVRNVPAYGTPPPPPPADAGSVTCDDGGIHAAYGGPVLPPCPRDGGPDDRGGGMAEYGGPPPRDD